MSDGVPVALVTGAGRGLGRGIAVALAAAGCSVAINFVKNRETAEETAALCRDAASSRQLFIPLQGDVASAADRARLVATTVAELGRIDALVNNAGIAPRLRADVTETTEVSFQELLRTNLEGPFFLTQRVVRHWLGNGRRASRLPDGFKVVFVTSISADTASTSRAEYCISKAGLSMAARVWATRLAREGIQVVELRPGIMATDMTAGVKEHYDHLLATGLVPQMRWGTAEDVGLAVRAVLVGSFPFSTGAMIPIDGGFHLPRL